jgi:hypothetical protein
MTFPLIAAEASAFSVGKNHQAEALRRDHEGLKKTINKFE